MLCGEALAGLSGAMKMIKFNVGNEFEVVTVSFNPQRDARHRRRQESGIPQALRTPRRRCRLAFPDRARRVHQRAHQGRRLPVSVRRKTQSVRARHRHHGADAARPHLALLLRRGFSAKRSAHGTGRSLAETKSATPSIRCCSTAITTIPPPENTARSSPTCCGSGAAITILFLGGLLFILFGWTNRATPRIER